jgi:hypothetical protein
LIYVLVFTFLGGFTFIFTDTYGFSDGQRGSDVEYYVLALCGCGRHGLGGDAHV